MSGLPVANVLPLSGGSLVCGCAITVGTLTVYKYGVAVDITNDRKRQLLLNAMCTVAATCSYISLALNQTKQAIPLNNACIFMLFVLIQYSLVIINHNTIMRLRLIIRQLERWRVEHINRACMVLYCLPPIVLVPIYYAFIDTEPRGVPINASSYNSLIYKPMGIALLVLTEGLAVVTDVLLLLKPNNNSDKLRPGSTDHLQNGVLQKTKKLWMNYSVAWLFLVADIVLKVLIALGYPALFDSAVTVAGLIVRARLNIRYGINIRETYYKSSTLPSGKETQAKGHRSTKVDDLE